eukprot:jgi/Tetstr1/441561/TSEL_029790.t1
MDSVQRLLTLRYMDVDITPSRQRLSNREALQPLTALAALTELDLDVSGFRTWRLATDGIRNLTQLKRLSLCVIWVPGVKSLGTTTSAARAGQRKGTKAISDVVAKLR